MRPAALAATLCATLLVACAPAEGDGEPVPPVPPGPLAAAPAKAPDARRVVVDTDLGRDDLLALALLVRHPGVRVEAVTIAATGLVGCADGRPILAALFRDLDAPVPPVACGPGESPSGARPFPAPWRTDSARGSGLDLDVAPVPVVDADAPGLLADLATRAPGLTVVALGPLTNLAELARRDPPAYRDLAGIHAMAGSTQPGRDDGVAEWNAAADPGALAAVLDPALAGAVPVTLVPADAVPPGTPDALAAPVVGRIATPGTLDRWWDLAAAAALLAGLPTQQGAERGTWRTDADGLLTREGDGPVAVIRTVPPAVVEEACAASF
ncbi:nucleoside hydrolase [Nocardioides daeguensis]|uniref:Inosine/uridine-preferring nucleoside hydrolase domain-containing protein n=1 Tax=Nocardioides daeguensis TaxID=908359 RepID=A0ABP6UTN7_9ACTN|nr:nucleoside hydrolase [Nocardioides daeguensis]MBV6728645.1 nucleoside hydrolase [Nocardioides daeguensis]MCR1773746.1 nucleoside hydrolase [Nocardioides daeguensis]